MITFMSNRSTLISYIIYIYIQGGFYIWFPPYMGIHSIANARSLLMQISSSLDFRIYFLQKCA